MGRDICYQCNPKQKTLQLLKGQSETLTATVEPTNANNTEIEWSSGDETIATVDNDGKVTAKNVGEAIITVTTEEGGKTDTCTVVVEDIPAPTGLIWDDTKAKWDAVEGATSYSVFLLCSQDPAKVNYNMDQAGWISTIGTETELNLEEHLHPGMTYQLRVRALIGSTQGILSDYSDKKTMDGNLGNISISWGSGTDENKASWDAVEGAEGYLVWVKYNGNPVGAARSITESHIDITSDINDKGYGTYTVDVYAGTGTDYVNYLAEGTSEDKVVAPDPADAKLTNIFPKYYDGQHKNGDFTENFASETYSYTVDSSEETQYVSFELYTKTGQTVSAAVDGDTLGVFEEDYGFITNSVDLNKAETVVLVTVKSQKVSLTARRFMLLTKTAHRIWPTEWRWHEATGLSMPLSMAQFRGST